jgi:hypothetical protein
MTTSTSELYPGEDTYGQSLLVNVTNACTMLFGNATEATRMRLYRMIERDEISAKKFGRIWWIPRAEIARLASPAAVAVAAEV